MKTKKKIIGLSVFIVFLILLPIGVKNAAVHYLTRAGAENVSIEDVDLNLFSGTLAIQALNIQSSGHKPLILSSAVVNISMLRLLTGKLIVERAMIDGLEVTVENTPDAIVAGFPVFTKKMEKESADEDAEQNDDEIPFGIKNLLISDSLVTYTDSMENSSLKITAVKLLDFYLWKKESPSVLKVNTLVNDARLEADIVMKPFAETRSFDSRIQLDELKLSSFSGYLKEYASDFETIVSTDLKISAQIAPDNAVAIEQSGALKIDGIKGNPFGLPVPVNIIHAAFEYDGSATLKLPAGQNFPVFDVKGTLANNDLDLIVDGGKIRVNHGGLSWTGLVTNTTGMIEDSAVSGTLVFDHFLIRGENQENSLFSFDKLSLNDLTSAGLKKIGLASVVLSGLDVAKPANTEEGKEERRFLKPVMTDTVTISNISLEEMDSLKVDTVEIENVTVPLKRNNDGKLPLAELFKSFSKTLDTLLARTAVEKEIKPDTEKTASEEETTAEVMSETAPVQENTRRFIIDVGSVSLKGDNTILVEDSYVKPAYKKTIKIETFTLSDIRNVNIDDKASLDVKIKTDKHGFIDIKGDAQIFNPKVTLHMKGNVKGVHLAELSPYTASAVGYNIQTGVFNTTINCKIVSDKLDVKNDMFIENIVLTPNAKNSTEKFTKMFLMPVDQTLSVLKDDKNNIRLSIPVTGDINNPDFHYQDVMKLAMQKAVKSASISVLKNLIQPYGVVITATQYALAGKEYLEKIRLDPIYFKPGSPAIEKEGLDYLNTIVKLLKQKKDLRLSACGLAVRADVQGGDPVKHPEPYIEISKQRQSNIIHYLEENGIPHERLFHCNGDVDVDEKALPRIDMFL